MSSKICKHKDCQNKIEMYPKYCFIHTLILYNVFISKSNIKNAGYGLFAGPKGFKKDDIIGEYSSNENKVSQGEIKKSCFNKDKTCWTYVLCESDKINDDVVCWNDTNELNSTYVRYINDAYNTKYENNASFYIKKEHNEKRAYVIAKKDIRPYEEIFVSYGNYYWN
jgi:hypothetical protein